MLPGPESGIRHPLLVPGRYSARRVPGEGHPGRQTLPDFDCGRGGFYDGRPEGPPDPNRFCVPGVQRTGLPNESHLEQDQQQPPL